MLGLERRGHRWSAFERRGIEKGCACLGEEILSRKTDSLRFALLRAELPALPASDVRDLTLGPELGALTGNPTFATSANNCG